MFTRFIALFALLLVIAFAVKSEAKLPDVSPEVKAKLKTNILCANMQRIINRCIINHKKLFDIQHRDLRRVADSAMQERVKEIAKKDVEVVFGELVCETLCNDGGIADRMVMFANGEKIVARLRSVRGSAYVINKRYNITEGGTLQVELKEEDDSDCDERFHSKAIKAIYREQKEEVLLFKNNAGGECYRLYYTVIKKE